MKLRTGLLCHLYSLFASLSLKVIQDLDLILVNDLRRATVSMEYLAVEITVVACSDGTRFSTFFDS